MTAYRFRANGFISGNDWRLTMGSRLSKGEGISYPNEFGGKGMKAWEL